MSSYRLEISYDGTRFRGWARQPGLRTVQGELEGALERLFGRPVPLTVAGRTDAGVHALGQVASFEAPEEAVAPERDPSTLFRALNALTAEDLAVTEVRIAADGFDARHDARARRYRYRLAHGRVQSPFERRYSLHWPYPLDHASLAAAAAALPGIHDFTAFTPTETEHVRFEREVIEAAWSRESAEIVRFEIEADAFMRNMVRVLVGTMLEVGGGRRELADFETLLAGGPRAQAGETAPAHGLFLLGVRYRPGS